MTCGAYHRFFLNLSNPLKMAIVYNLKKEESSVNELSEKLGIEQSKLSHALMSLKHCNIVDFKKNGKQRIYFLNKKTIIPIFDIIDKHNCKCTLNKNEKC